MIPESGPARRVFSVTEIAELARDRVEAEFSRIWVKGEISNFKAHSSGHFYFTLKDAGSQLRAAMFRGANRGLRFSPEDGLSVIAGGRLSIYAARGDFQMVVESLEPAGAGALQLALEQLKKRLAAEGLFDSARKRPLPAFPRSIAVVTSPTGAAIRDILQVSGRRSSLADIFIYPVRVQGEGAALEIARALNRLNESGVWDVIVCARGGGSLEDLWAFNEEPVVRAIAASKIPVISAVGHEVDFTLSDLAADVRAETPTAAAELVLRDRRELLEQVRHFRRRLSGRLGSRLREERGRLERLLRSPTLQQPRRVFEPLAQRVDDLSVNLQSGWKNYFQLARERFRGRLAQLEALSPLRVMGRGYSLVYRALDRQLLSRADGLQAGDPLEIVFHKGRVLCEVKEVKN